MILGCCKSRWLPKKQYHLYVYIYTQYICIYVDQSLFLWGCLSCTRYTLSWLGGTWGLEDTFLCFLSDSQGLNLCGQMVNPQFSLDKHVWLGKFQFFFVSAFLLIRLVKLLNGFQFGRFFVWGRGLNCEISPVRRRRPNEVAKVLTDHVSS